MVGVPIPPIPAGVLWSTIRDSGLRGRIRRASGAIMEEEIGQSWQKYSEMTIRRRRDLSTQTRGKGRILGRNVENAHDAMRVNSASSISNPSTDS